jgi:hypothetical protein
MNDDDRDILISRIADGEASDRDWATLERLAEDDPKLWRHVSEAQRDHAGLVRLVARAGAMATAVAAPDTYHLGFDGRARPLRTARSASGDASGRGARHRRAWTTFGSWAGWAVAAVLFLAVVPRNQAPLSSSSPPVLSNNASLVPTATNVTAQDAFQTYLERGREEGIVLSERPRRLVVESRAMPSGEIEIIYIQQVMERTVVPHLYQFRGLSEQGRPTLVRMEQPRRSEM